MNQRIITNRPLRARTIYFKDNSEPLRDRVIWLAANYLVVGVDENDEAPTWYNADRVDRLEGVEELDHVPRHGGGRIVFL